MAFKYAVAGTVFIVTATVTTACGPLSLDHRPHIRGTVMTVDGHTLTIRHKTGRTYEVGITPDTRVVSQRQARDARLCPGQRATVFLADAPGRFTASSITLWSDRCQAAATQ